jgi:hypothetical protein
MRRLILSTCTRCNLTGGWGLYGVARWCLAPLNPAPKTCRNMASINSQSTATEPQSQCRLPNPVVPFFGSCLISAKDEPRYVPSHLSTVSTLCFALDDGSKPGGRTGDGPFCKARMQMPHALLFFFVALAVYSGERPAWDVEGTFAEGGGTRGGSEPSRFRGRASMPRAVWRPDPGAGGRAVVLLLAHRVEEKRTMPVLAGLKGMGGDHPRLPPASSPRSVLSECWSTHPV